MLVVEASIIGRGGEIFILRMGQPIRIVEIAKDLITLHGFRPEIDIKIDLVGLRPGEKVHEALVAVGEKVLNSSHRHILSTRATVPDGMDVLKVVEELRELTNRGNRKGIVQLLNSVIPDANLLLNEGNEPS